MDKQTLLKTFYQTQIENMIESINDISLLDLIYKLLLKNMEDETK